VIRESGLTIIELELELELEYSYVLPFVSLVCLLATLRKK